VAISKTLLGQHEVLWFDRYKYPPLDELPHKIKLWETDKKGIQKKLIAGNLSLQELYENHVKPGEMVCSTHEVMKGRVKLLANDDPEAQMPKGLRNYSLCKPYSFRAKDLNKPKGKHVGGLRQIILTDTSPPMYYRRMIDAAYEFLERKCVVEFSLRIQGPALKKKERIESTTPHMWQWLHSVAPHLRPDFIMKGMPENTFYLVEPISNGRVVQWVAGISPLHDNQKGLTKRLLNIKAQIQRNIDEGEQPMLPKKLREQLRESGNTEYSVNTALPKKLARKKFAKGGAVKYSAEEKKYFMKDKETDRFMSPEVELDPLIRIVDEETGEEMPLRKYVLHTRTSKGKKETRLFERPPNSRKTYSGPRGEQMTRKRHGVPFVLKGI
jgi:hypothetical protein